VCVCVCVCWVNIMATSNDLRAETQTFGEHHNYLCIIINFNFFFVFEQAYYASFMPDNMREELMEVARSNNFIIKYDKYDWNLHLAPILKSQVCSGYIV
jgi:hypothetical protein